MIICNAYIVFCVEVFKELQILKQHFVTCLQGMGDSANSATTYAKAQSWILEFYSFLNQEK